ASIQFTIDPRLPNVLRTNDAASAIHASSFVFIATIWASYVLVFTGPDNPFIKMRITVSGSRKSAEPSSGGPIVVALPPLVSFTLDGAATRGMPLPSKPWQAEQSS